MKIALDLDGTLADLRGAMISHSSYDDSDFEQWEKPDFSLFLSEASTVWDDYWWDVQPVEPYLHEKTKMLSGDHHVDIVTNTVGSNEVTQKWLDKHDICYEDVVRPSTVGASKSELDYDVYIDDKPSMAGTVSLLYIPDRQWNQDVRGLSGAHDYLYHSYEPSFVESEGFPSGQTATSAPHVIRVTDLHDVVYDLCRTQQ